MPPAAGSPAVEAPSADALWERLRDFMGKWGVVGDSARGLRLTWNRGEQVTEVEMTRSQLHEHVAKFVHWRVEHDLDDGLANGLPLPLMDSFGDCFGPQQAPYARLVLDGLDFRVVSTTP